MATILDKIVAEKRQEIARRKEQRPLAALRARLSEAPPVRDFLAPLAVDRPRDGGPIKLIAEVKKASPSAGLIREDFDPVGIAEAYAEHGARCLSVLTDGPFFRGSLQYLSDVRAAVELPLLRKDFILDEYQLCEARLAGADAVLLIAECLTPEELCTLHQKTHDLGMHALVELYERENLPAVLAANAHLVGVNNRNLHTFEVDLRHCLRLHEELPDEVVFVAESGVRTHFDAEHLRTAGVDAMLVGESLMREEDVGAAVSRLLNG